MNIDERVGRLENVAKVDTSIMWEITTEQSQLKKRIKRLETWCTCLAIVLAVNILMHF